MTQTTGTPEIPSPTRPPQQAISDSAVRRKRISRLTFRLAAVALVVVALAVGLPYYLHAIAHESTDDAFIDGQIVPISPRVPGHVARVYVDDNQKVAAGDLLLELDPRDFQARLDAAQAMVQNARALVDAAKSRKGESQAQLDFAKAALEQAQAEQISSEAKYRQSAADLKRSRELAAGNTISPQQLDHAATAERINAADLNAARSKVTTQRSLVQRAQASLKAADDNVRQAEAQVAARRAELEQVALNLSYTKIHAPIDGYVSKKGVEPGAFVQVGQSLLAMVSPGVWVTANFKETQLTQIRPGQPAVISVDTFPGATFHGHVDSIQRGTGSRFSLLPPENATGNYVKVVQRIPVKIVFDRPRELAEYLLVPGMSVVPEVNIKAEVPSGLAGGDAQAAE